MSKEQTPIEVFCEELMEEIQEGTSLSNVIDKVSKRENAKVLEALEREVPKACISTQKWSINQFKIMFRPQPKIKIDVNPSERQAKRYYETEVKPKYNPEN